MHRRLLILFALSFSVVTLMVACDGPVTEVVQEPVEEPTEEGEPLEESPDALVIFATWAEDDFERERLEEMFEEFEQANPGVTIQDTIIGPEVSQ